MSDNDVVISYRILPERLDPSSIPAEYLVSIWNSVNLSVQRAKEVSQVSLKQLYSGKVCRGWVLELRSTRELMVIFRSPAHDALFLDWRTRDFNLIDSLPLVPGENMKLMRKKRINKTKSQQEIK